METPAALLGVVLGLTALLAIASGGAPIWVPRGIAGLDRRTIVAALAVLFSLCLLLATVGAVILHRRGAAGARGPDSLRSIFLGLMPITVIGWVTIGLFGIAEGYLGRPPEAVMVGPRLEPTMLGKALQFIGGWDTPVVTDQGRRPPDGGAGDPIPSPPLSVIVGLVALSVAAAWRVWRRADGRTPPDDGPETRAELEPLDAGATHHAFVETIAAMLADPDPNTAVIGAYARLLEGLADAGAPRRDHEGPEEHLRRVLGMLPVERAPLRRLVSLFESARFSSRTLTAQHRVAAIEALQSVAASLGPRAAPANTASSPSRRDRE